ncbi:MAG TPA: hypothetical protein VFD58_31735 [Blastocatellia bacterium]|nr:hypothetical protein [Blastocatellia bacterium]
MTRVLWLLAIQGALGAFDTLYYHEWRARLVAHRPLASSELKLHAARDFIYAIVFGALPWLAWQGYWAVALAALLLAEIAITLADFIIEDRVRHPLGGVYPGERAMHAVMGIIYGGMLACLLPILSDWWRAATALTAQPPDAPQALRWLLAGMALGVFLSGVRDLCAALELPHSNWPWRSLEPGESGARL